MTFPTHSLRGFTRWASLLVAIVALAGIAQQTDRVAAAADDVTQVRMFGIASCNNGGSPQLNFAINGVSLGSAVTTSDCSCVPTQKGVTSTNSTVLAAVNAQACNDITISLTGGTTYLNYVKAEITRSTSGVESVCVFDKNNSNCTNDNICSPGLVNFSNTSWHGFMDDSDGDGDSNCTDNDLDGDGVTNGADFCPLVADANNGDADGDGVGNVCDALVRTVPWLGLPNKPHEVYSGGSVILQGVATAGYTDTPLTLTDADWDPGDGSPAVDIPHTNPLALELTHTYTAVDDDQPYTATLTVTTSTGEILTDTFKVVVRAKTVDVEANMAIDKGLWYLHKQVARATEAGVPVGFIEFTAGAGQTNGRFASTAAAAQAMQINNHVTTGQVLQDPYIHDVSRLLRWMEARLATQTLSLQNGNNPDTNGNNLGVFPNSGDIFQTGGTVNYIVGQVMDAFVSSGTPDQVAVIGPANVKGREYSALVQDMMDFSSWAQIDTGTSRGSWHYNVSNNSASGHDDNSIAQWPAIGAIAAERVWGLTTPDWVKTDVKNFLPLTYNAGGSLGSPALSTAGAFGYSTTNNLPWSEGFATTPSALVQYIWAGVVKDSTPDDAHETKLRDGFNFAARYHRVRNNYKCCDTTGHINGINFYGLYATTKAYRLALQEEEVEDPPGTFTTTVVPKPVELIDDDPTDAVPAWHWYYNDPPATNPPAAAGPVGVARAVISNQQASGQFPGSYQWNGNLSTAWGVIILSPSLFQLGPTASCTATPNQIGRFGGTVAFNGTGSFHNDDDGEIVSYTWNFGDSTAGSGETTSHAYPAGAPQTFNATLTVTDSNNLSDTASCSVTRVDNNVRPTAVIGGPYNFCLGSPMIVNGSASFDEEDGDVTSYAWDLVSPVNFSAIDATTAQVDVSSFFTSVGTFTLGLRVTDSEGATGTAFGDDSVIVRAATDPACNQPPVATNNSYTIAEDTVLTANAVTDAPADTDVDGDTLTATLVTGVSNGSLVFTNGAVSYTPNLNYCGPDSFTYKVNDGTVDSNTATVLITVTCANDPPVANDDSHTIAEDTQATGTATSSDTDGGAPVYSLSSGPASGTATVNPDGSYTYAPNLNFNGNDSFEFQVSDSAGGTDIGLISITVTPVNDPPVANDNSHTIAEDAQAAGNATSSDPDGGAPVYALSTPPANGSVTVNPDGSYTYTPTLNYNGPDSFEFTVSDGAGGTDTGLVTITVTPVNDPPVANDNSHTIAEDGEAMGTATSSDGDGGAPTYALGSGPSNGLVDFNADGSYTYTPADDYHGGDSFTFTVSDGNGGSDTGTVTITITPVNDPPVALDDNRSTSEDTVLDSFVTDNDSATDVDGDTLTWTLTSEPSHGTLSLSTTGVLLYTPAANYCGPDSFTYDISDGTVDEPATVNINVVCVNDAPVANDNTHTTLEDTAVAGDATSSDGDGGTPVYALGTGPSNGSVDFNANGSYVYTPNPNYFGGDSFTFAVSDGNGGSDTGTVTITVAPVNDAPVAVNDAYAGQWNTPLNVSSNGSPSGVRANNDSDIDTPLDAVTVIKLTNPSHGTVTLNADGSFTYIPLGNYSGTDSFTYKLNDGGLDSLDTATVVITINSPCGPKKKGKGHHHHFKGDGDDHDKGRNGHRKGDKCDHDRDGNGHGHDHDDDDDHDDDNIVCAPGTPKTNKDNYSMKQNTTLTISAKSGVRRNDGKQPTTIELWSTSTHGTLALAADGSFVYTPTVGFYGTDTFYYVARSTGGIASHTERVTIQVTRKRNWDDDCSNRDHDHDRDKDWSHKGKKYQGSKKHDHDDDDDDRDRGRR